MIKMIISGGQTGADIAGLLAAKKLGLKTGGYMPKGFRTEAGPRPEYRTLYGLEETNSWRYPDRTRRNVLASNATVIFGNIWEPGSSLTMRYCKYYSRGYYIVPVLNALVGLRDTTAILGLQNFLVFQDVTVLNVAGNRESAHPGICEFTLEFLVRVIGELNS
jgi:hypothetical protein